MPRAKKKSAKKEDKPVFSAVNLPDAVKKADELASQKQAELQPKDPFEDEVIEDTIEDDPPAPDPEVVPPAQPEPTPAQPEAAPQASPSEWENKYKVLQGKYNSEIGELRAVVGNLQNLVNQQNGLIGQLQEQRQAPAAPAAEPTSPQADFDIPPLNPEDFSGYGDDIMFMAQGFNKLLEVNKQQAARIAQLSGGGQPADNQRLERVEQFMTETAQDRYNREMDSQVPKWREIIYSDDFVGWLNGVDPLSNYRYRDMFEFAQKNFRHQQAAAMIERYGRERNLDISGNGSGKPPIVDNTINDPLAGQAMPDASTGDTTPVVNPSHQNVQYPSQADVAKASDLYAQGKITAQKFNEISDRFMMGLKSGAVKAT